MKAQKSVFGKIVEVDGLFLFEDSAGVMFNVPQLNEEGTSLYVRARQASKKPEKYGFKMTKDGRLDKRTKYGRVLQPMLDDLN